LHSLFGVKFEVVVAGGGAAAAASRPT